VGWGRGLAAIFWAARPAHQQPRRAAGNAGFSPRVHVQQACLEAGHHGRLCQAATPRPCPPPPLGHRLREDAQRRLLLGTRPPRGFLRHLCRRARTQRALAAPHRRRRGARGAPARGAGVPCEDRHQLDVRGAGAALAQAGGGFVLGSGRRGFGPRTARLPRPAPWRMPASLGAGALGKGIGGPRALSRRLLRRRRSALKLKAAVTKPQRPPPTPTPTPTPTHPSPHMLRLRRYTLFFILGELWGSVAISLLFWCAPRWPPGRASLAPWGGRSRHRALEPQALCALRRGPGRQQPNHAAPNCPRSAVDLPPHHPTRAPAHPRVPSGPWQMTCVPWTRLRRCTPSSASPQTSAS
jgi:hypothetical protein